MLAKYKHIIIYGFSLAILLFLMKWLEYRFIIIDHALEIYIGAIAVIFTSLGIWLALKLSSPKVKTIKVKEEVYIYGNEHFTLNQVTLLKLNLSKRELEVLQLMANGLSNQEIAERLFLSLNTIKTHSSKLFEKLEVDRRTQAIDKAKKLNIIS
jgi:DNA-binding CsgD family transcriptional regulator